MIDVQAYFKRLGIPPETEITHTAEFLKTIQYHHVLAVPYENLDLVDGRLLSFEIPDLIDKIVTRGRGGYCFEVNCLLSHFLQEHGFQIRDFLARYMRGEQGVPMRRHRVVAVECEGRTYICDVGVGQSAPRYPVILEEGLVQEQFGETYCFKRDESLGWVLCDLYKGEWRPFIAFTEELQYDIDFIQPSFYYERHPESAFNKTPIVAIKTVDGRKTLNDREFKEFRNGEIVRLEQDVTDERRDELLQDEFGIRK